MTKKENPKKRKVRFNANVKYGNTPYEKGEGIEVNESEYELLLKAQVVEKEKGD